MPKIAHTFQPVGLSEYCQIIFRAILKMRRIVCPPCPNWLSLKLGCLRLFGQLMPTKSFDIDTFRYLLLFIQTGRLYIFHISNPKQLKMMEIVETEKRLWGENNSGFPKDSYARSNHRQRKPQVTEPPFYLFQNLNSFSGFFFLYTDFP